MSNSPMVSIIMPVYKVEKYIGESIKSVLRQTYKNIELVLVDDGSPDNSVCVAEKILASTKMAYQIIRQQNAGQGRARNAGIDRAAGEWILFLDSDDLIADDTIEHLVNACIANDADIAFSGVNYISAANDAVPHCMNGKTICLSAKELQTFFLKRSMVVLAPGTLYRKQLLIDNDLRFEGIPWSEDQQFVWRVLYHIKKAVFVDEPLYQYLQHAGSIMSATKVRAMADSYSAICDLQKYYEDDPEVSRFIVPRWVMGTMNSAASIDCFPEWKSLWHEIEGRRNFRVLFGFPDGKVKGAALVGWLSPTLYYYIVRIKKHM